MRFIFDKKLPALLTEIEETLVAMTPKSVAKLRVSEPAYAVFLWYEDSSVCGDFVPSFGVGVESMRVECSRRSDNRDSVNDCIWRPQQEIAEFLPSGRFKERALIEKCNEAYDLMLAANKTGLPLEDEGEILRPFRSMMHRVASRLNLHPWDKVLKTMEEFVVVSLDQIGYWIDEDMKKSIPEARLKLLKQRGLI